MTLLDQMARMPIVDKSLAIWGMGQMGLAVKGPDAMIYIDLCLSDVVRSQFGDWWYRAYDPPLMPSTVSNASFYFISHEHLDHLDPETVGPIAKASPNARFVTTAWCNTLLNDLGISNDRIINPTTARAVTLPGTSLKVTAVPGAHYELEHDPVKGYRYIGFLIEWNGVTLYHAGDTIVYDGLVQTMRSLPTVDVAMVPVNGRDWYRENEIGAVGNLLPVEAGRLAHDLGWDVLVPGHNDLYPNNAIPMGEIIEGVFKVDPRQKVKLLQPGELYYYAK